MAKIAEEVRNLAYERAGGGPSESTYDPELLDVMTRAADALEAARGTIEKFLRYTHACCSCTTEDTARRLTDELRSIADGGPTPTLDDEQFERFFGCASKPKKKRMK